MAFFEWRANFNIGIEEIDRQHKTFLVYLNECYDQIAVDNRAEIAPQLIDNLKAYAAKHFRFEEGVMQSKDYPELTKHEEQHRYFEDQIIKLEGDRSSGTGSAAKTVLPFLRDWFVDHILDQDRKYVSYLA